MTNQLDELLKTRATLEEALMAADGLDTPETAELRGAIAAIDAVMAPIHLAQYEADLAKVRLGQAQRAHSNARQFDSMVSDDADGSCFSLRS